MAEPADPIEICVFCGTEAPAAVRVERFGVASCLECATRIGRLVSGSASSLGELWPMLAVREDDDELEPEPKVRRPDGRAVELREVTRELKEELPVDKRMQLAETYGTLGLLREQIEECGYVLGQAPSAELAQRAFDLLFSRPLYRPKELDALRGRLFPA